MYFLIFLQQLLASFTHIIAKDLTFTESPVVITFFRAAMACSVYIIYIIIYRKKLRMIEKKDIGMLFLIGLLNIPLNQFLFMTSISYTSPPNVALAYALTPVFVYIIATVFFDEIRTKLRTLGIFIAFSGTFIVLFEKGFDLASDHFFGDMLVLLASLAFALYLILIKDISRKYGALYSNGISMITGFILFIPVFMLWPIEYKIVEITTTEWLQIAYLGIVMSGFAYAIWFIALKRIASSKIAVFNNLQPVFTTILSILIFQHELTVQFVIGGMIIIAGVILTQRG
jgi:drug/metabolite transporter (DMT)-like permease